MKKYLMIATSLACGLQITCASPAAFAANLSPYQYNPKQPPVEIDLSVLDEAETKQKPESSPAAPMALTPPAAAQQQEQPPAQETAEAPADPTETFLDKIMANHLPPGTKKKTVKAPVAVTPPAPMRKPAVPVAEAPVETKPAVEPAPAVTVEPKAEEKPAETETQAAPEMPTEEKPVAETAPAATEEPKAEEKPAGPVVRERRRKTSEAEAPAPASAEMTVAFDKISSELSPAAQKDLDTLVAKIADMPDQRIQLLGHATGDGNPSDARRMSLSRALIVRSYLTDKGISPSRLDVRALGAEGDAPPSDQVELVFVK